jgi:hypothetical protein
MGRTIAESVLVALVATTIAGVLSWPLPIAPAQHVIGASFNDQHSLAWTLQWVADRLATGALPWGHTDAVAWPDGGTLFPADLLEAALLAPLTWAWGGWVSLNVLTVLHHGLAAGAGWGWLRTRGAGAAGATAGALILALAPALVTSSWNGNPDVTGLAWVLAALWAAEAGHGVAAGVLVGLTAMVNPYPAVMGGVALCALLARRPRVLLRAAIPMACGAIAAWSLTTGALGAPDAMIERAPRDGALMGTASLAGFVWPLPEVVPTDPRWDLSHVATGAYLGWAALLAALAARRDRLLGWSLVFMGVVAALGPELRVVSEMVTPSGPQIGPPVLVGTGIPLPWALVESLPGFEMLHQTARFVTLAAIGLAVLAAAGAAQLGRWRWLVPVAVAADLLILAQGAAQLQSVPVWDDGACAALAPLEPGPVLDLPPEAHELGLVGALCHTRPVGAAINRPLPPAVGERLGPPGPKQARGIMRAAAEADFRWVVHHKSLPDPHLEASLTAYSRCRVHDSGDLAVYDMDCLRLDTP